MRFSGKKRIYAGLSVDFCYNYIAMGLVAGKSPSLVKHREERMKKIPWKFVILAAVLLCHGLPMPAMAFVTGQVLDAAGSVTIQRVGGERLAGLKGFELLPGDRLVTGPDGIVQFYAEPGNNFILFENSSLIIDELQAVDANQIPYFNLEIGMLRSKAANIDGFSGTVSMFVLTPAAVLVSRRNDFIAAVGLDSATVVSVNNGAVDVDTDLGRMIVTEGQAVRVGLGEQPVAAELLQVETNALRREWQQAHQEAFFQDAETQLTRFQSAYALALENFDDYADFLVEVNQSLDIPLVELNRIFKRKNPRDASIPKLATQMLNRKKKFQQRLLWFRGGMNHAFVMADHFARIEQAASSRKLEVGQLELLGSVSASVAEKNQEVHRKTAAIFTGLQKTANMFAELEESQKKETEDYNYNIKVIDIRKRM